MAESNDTWGQRSFEVEKRWYAHLSTDSWRNLKDEYSDHLQKSLNNPEYDLFDHFMPTGRPKHDIGRFVLRHGVHVPLVTSLTEWQQCMMTGTAMLRSEQPQDYSGYSGLFSSIVLNSLASETEEFLGHTFSLRRLNTFIQNDFGENKNETIQTINEKIEQALYAGEFSPSTALRMLIHDSEIDDFNRYDMHHSNGVSQPFIGKSDLYASRWRFIPGVNLRVFRDPIINGKYFIGGRDAHHHWEISDGERSPNVDAHPKSVYRGANAGAPEYTLPTAKIVRLYEKIRTLPYFDASQVPLMEMQLGLDGRLHFLQYKKTGVQLSDCDEFNLPTGRNVVTIHDVRGSTHEEGEKVRMYLNPNTITPAMCDQAIIADQLSEHGFAAQLAAFTAKVIGLPYYLSFKNNHYSDAALTHAPVALGLWDGVGEAADRLNSLSSPQGGLGNEDYINAIITSNGRKATIDSDWQVINENTD